MSSMAAFCLLFLALIFSPYANSARLLNEVAPQDPPATSSPSPLTTFPSGQIPAVPTVFNDDDPEIPSTPDDDNVAPLAPPATVAPPLPGGGANTVVGEPEVPPPTPDDDDVAPPAPTATMVPPLPDGGANTVVNGEPEVNPPTPDDDDVAPVVPPITVAPPLPIPLAIPSSASPAAAATVSKEPALSFFMHDILGGSQPSVRIVTGIIARTDINGIPFSVPNNNFFPLQGGTPLPNLNNLNSLINPTTVPLITGLNPGQSNTVLQNSANNNNVVNGNNQPFVTAGQLSAGSIQRLMFGSITVIDDELTEGHELGSTVLGRAQGFYLASSLDGTSHTMAFSVILHGEDGHHGDGISFFGVHRTASPESQIAVVGGTGKYENAKGYAIVESVPQVDQHTTDGVDTIMHFTVYLTV